MPSESGWGIANVAKRATQKREIKATWGGAGMERARNFIEDPKTERVIAVLIVLNAIVLGLETSPDLMARYGVILEALDHTLLAIFAFEVVTRLVVTGRNFFRDPWNVFDFIVITLSLMPQTGPLSVLRALRVLRVLRLVSAVPTLRRVVAGLIGSLPGIGAIALLLSLVYYVFAVMATNLFGPDFPQEFGSLSRSAYALFVVMTLEGWADLANRVMEKHPYAWMFFIPYILTTTFTVLNLFIAIIVNAMQTEAEATRSLEVAEHQKEQQRFDSLGTKEEQILAELRALRADVNALRGKK